ncbi:MAG: NAD(P)-binding domain-containing protein [Deltaproteobacteria bacterium]|nr:NAD(P)-binding domain-containing protein [Deltaproteobacteria bacterium]
MAQKVGVLGSGQVGQVLAAGFKRHGYDVTIGSREPEKLKAWQAAAGQGVALGTFAEAAAAGDIVVLAVKGTVASEALKLAGAANLKGKLVIDATNPIAEAPPEQGVLKFFTDLTSSLMEKLQAEHPDAKFVKAFSSVGSAQMVNPSYPGGRPTMFIAGNDAAAKTKVGQILDQFGWDVEDMGTAAGARAIEPLCIVWCLPGFLRNQWNHAFKVLKP